MKQQELARLTLTLPPPPPGTIMTSPERRKRPERGARCAEMVGGTTAECAAVVCCCPCGLASLLVLAVVWLPVGLCRRAMRRRRKRGKKKADLLRSRPGSFDDEELGINRAVPMVPESWPAKSPSMEFSEREKEMWDQFYCSTGFWRSSSQRQ